MFVFKTGDLLRSDAEALVNTVNCEGHMGKGLAYQFRQQYPLMNRDYEAACRAGRLRPGRMHWFREGGKLIINFPTKDRWRARSLMSYIEDGLDALVDLIDELEISSIAIPPLGSGNGGLRWEEVREVILCKLQLTSETVEIQIYEPSQGAAFVPAAEPKLGSAALILLELEERLEQVNELRIQQAAYFLTLFSGIRSFHFRADRNGVPRDAAVERTVRSIRSFQKYHQAETSGEAKDILYRKMVSTSVIRRMEKLKEPIRRGAELVNRVSEDRDLACLGAVTLMISQDGPIEEARLVTGLRLWAEPGENGSFTESEIGRAIDVLYDCGVIESDLIGYRLTGKESNL